MSETRSYDVAVLGGGPGGYAAALRAAVRGAKACCIEAGLLGGTCLNAGCIPTKAMLRAGEVFHSLAGASQFGLRVGPGEVDGRAVMARIAATVGNLRKGLTMLLSKRGVDVIAGRGRLTGPREIAVQTADGAVSVTAKAVVLATGSAAIRPDWLPWPSGRIMTTDEALAAESLPDSVIILGGGAIGCEFATAYSELGVATTVVEMLDRPAPGLEADAGRAIARSLKRRKVQLHTSAKATSVTADEAGVTVQLDGGQTLKAARLLAAVGRRAATEDIGLEQAGVEVVAGVVKVDDRCRTNVEGVYAVGDLAEARQYAHLAMRMGVVAGDNATGHDARDDRTVVPIGVYTRPEVAVVGAGEQQAHERCPSLRVGRYSYQASGMAHARGEPEGQVKLYADEKTERILGALVIGPHATDVIQEIAVAMRNGVTVSQLAETIHPHPTFAEGVGEAAEAWLGLPLHMLG
ncbi:MAG TPA: dihydrolipoyl dehydrogenase [Phycisphaerae bacterium]|nr:dihydrolipoyl dehydrogenase [Phycisphaerae bacterium]